MSISENDLQTLLQNVPKTASPQEPYAQELARWQKELPLGKYRHFKGSEYRLLTIGLSSETTEVLCIYQALYGDRLIWVRPAAMWNEHVERDGYSGPRFAYVGE